MLNLQQEEEAKHYIIDKVEAKLQIVSSENLLKYSTCSIGLDTQASISCLSDRKYFRSSHAIQRIF